MRHRIFNKNITTLWVAGLLLMLLLAACGGGEETPTLAPAEDEDRDSLAAEVQELYSLGIDSTDGEVLYEIYCSKCHGLRGLGDGPSVGSLSEKGSMNLTDLSDRSDEELMQIISMGKNTEMPPWGLLINLEQRQAVLEFIRTLGG